MVNFESNDAEWVIRRADQASGGGYQLTCDGISEIVLGQEGIFLSKLEDRIQVLDPYQLEQITAEPPEIREAESLFPSHYAGARQP